MSNKTITHNMRKMSAWEKNILGVTVDKVLSLVPGLVVAILLAWLSIWLSKFIGVSLLDFEKTPISPVMLAILLGLIISTVIPMPKVLKPGLTFTVKKILRLGIIMLGIRLTIFDVFKLGAYGVPIVVICILSALFFTTRISKWFNVPERLGILIAVGTSICGVSAIVATGPALDADDEEVAYAVAVITIFGLLATLVYPYVTHTIFDGNALKAGLFLGTSIHDTSQVVGSATVYTDVFSAPLVLDTAMVTKLVRNVFMAAVIPFVALNYTRKTQAESSGKKTNFLKLLPLVVLGFLTISVIRSIGDAMLNTGGNALGLWDAESWHDIYTFVKTWAGYFLVIALAGVGLNTNFRTFKVLGIKPFLVGLGAALVVGIVSYIAISLLGSFVTL
ncbi:MAG: putative sulfate exporter family transporter [Anaerolineales bacterium]|nr:putative sulfate exporter family transporter [Anaerolineales bacterium]